MPLQGEDSHSALGPAARMAGCGAGRLVWQGCSRGRCALSWGHRHVTGWGRAPPQRQLVAGGRSGCQSWHLGRAVWQG
eukprot:8659766-Alexandrium_andersonii.AAC.1